MLGIGFVLAIIGGNGVSNPYIGEWYVCLGFVGIFGLVLIAAGLWTFSRGLSH
jgi:hypothetical protein